VTGLAASLCETPTPELKRQAEELLGHVAWGGRNAALYDLSEIATFVASSLLNPPPLEEFEATAIRILELAKSSCGWLYAAEDPAGHEGEIRYTIWTDFFECINCGGTSSFWERAVQQSPPMLLPRAICPHCGSDFATSAAPRAVEEYWDDLLGQVRNRRRREPVFVYGRTGSRLWKRPVEADDIKTLRHVETTAVPQGVPVVAMSSDSKPRWGEMFRSGYHVGVSHVHHFYTRRNLIALGVLAELIEKAPATLRSALRFWMSSYNASHSTLMTRIVSKRGADDFVVTSGQPGALYISSLPVEKNVFAGLQKKLGTVLEAFSAFQSRSNTVSVSCQSSLRVDLPDNSVDYVFTDPPFGQNIQYAEVNLISEAWLGRLTQAAEEVVISPTKGKTIREYQALLTRAFNEIRRILKPGRYLTVAFHSTSAETWDALRSAWEEAGFVYMQSTALDKTQMSFKQTTTFGAVQRDPLILLQKPPALASKSIGGPISGDLWAELDKYLDSYRGDDARSVDRHALYSWFIRLHLERGIALSVGAPEFFDRLSSRHPGQGDDVDSVSLRSGA